MKFLKHGMWPSLLISPGLCFIYALKQIRKGNVRASWVIPFIMGLFAFLFPPFADYARGLDRISQMQDLPISQVIILSGDIVLPICEYFFLKLGIPIEVFRFLYTFYVYFIFTKIFVDISKMYSMKNKQLFFVWVFLFMQIDFFAYIDNIRTIFVRLMLMYCAYQYFFKNINKYRYYALLLSIVHFAYFPILVLFFLSKYINLRLSRGVIIMLVFLMLFASQLSGFIDVVSLLSKFNFGDAINSKIIAYTEGEWSSDGEGLSNRSFAYVIYQNLVALSTYYLLFVYCKSKFRHKLEMYSSPLLLLCITVFAIPVLYGRYIGFFYSIISLFFLYGYLNCQISDKIMKNYLLLCLFNTLLNIYANWNCLVNGNVLFILLPFPIIMFQTYDFSVWSKEHLSDDFNKIINGGFLSR